MPIQPTPATVDPGPAGDFRWKGLNFKRRRGGGGPSNAAAWEPNNVIGPDRHGSVTLRISNPTGTRPRASEMVSTAKGMGYGTYALTVGTNLAIMHDNLVFGGLFTYDGSQAAHMSHNEIEVCETSSWGKGAPVMLDYTYFSDNPDTKSSVGIGHVVVRQPVSRDAVQTHMMRWEAGKITWWSWIGSDVTHKPFRSGRTTADVPIPQDERITMNLWDFGAGGAAMPRFEVILRDFSFVPLGEEIAAP